MNNAIFLTFDDKFFKYLKSCLISLEKNFPEHPEILAYYDGCEEEVLSFLRSVKHLKILTYNLDFIDLEGISLGVINSSKVYFRYILWTEQFDNYDTIVHLDADTIIRKSFENLFSKKEFFAVHDYTPFGRTLFKRQEYDNPELVKLLEGDDIRQSPSTIQMMNAGVFAIPKQYRTKEQFALLVDITKRYNAYTDFADQAAISLWCHINNISFSSEIEYNFQTCFLANSYIFYNELIRKNKSLADVNILHFTWWKTDTIHHQTLLENAKILVELEKEFL